MRVSGAKSGNSTGFPVVLKAMFSSDSSPQTPRRPTIALRLYFFKNGISKRREESKFKREYK